jgi:pyruvate/2-oxoglutarate dehydrogenase complex dihydrolipoamide acyltransferase (E2) component
VTNEADPNMFEEVTDPKPVPEETPKELTFSVDPSYKDYVDQYVGEGKKYSNVGELIKAYANADRHIPELTRDLAAIKTERDSLKEMLMANLTNENPGQEDPNPAPNPNPVESQPRPAEKQAKDNAKFTEEVMLQRFGDRDAAIKAVQDKAEELGVSPQWIAQMAFTSPKAYFVTMGIDPQNATTRSTTTPAPRSDVNPQRLADANPGIKPGTYEFYNNLRKTDPSKFRSAATQRQMMKDAQENPNFYNR